MSPADCASTAAVGGGGTVATGVGGPATVGVGTATVGVGLGLAGAGAVGTGVAGRVAVLVAIVAATEGAGVMNSIVGEAWAACDCAPSPQAMAATVRAASITRLIRRTITGAGCAVRPAPADAPPPGLSRPSGCQGVAG